MYFPGLGGCSSIIHIVAQRWKTVLAVGIIGTVTHVTTSLGPGNYINSGDALARYEQKLVSQNPGLLKQANEFEVAFQKLKTVPLSEANISYVINACEKCTDIDVGSVRRDPQLKERVARIYFADLAQRKGIEEAKKIYGELQR